MPSAEELRSGISESRLALRRAIEGAAPRWERSPDAEQWSPRQTAEHALAAELHFARELAAVTARGSVERREFDLASAADALAALAEVSAATAPAFDAVTDGDLALAVPLVADIDQFTGDVAGLMTLAAYHNNDHAQQVDAASQG